jgi:hypothetical protein
MAIWRARETSSMKYLAAALVTLSLSAACLAPASSCQAEDVAQLSDMLKNGLRVQRPKDLAFIKRVVELVDQGRLPVPLVKSTFSWARSKPVRYPFPYFVKALRIRAGKLGIRL